VVVGDVVVVDVDDGGGFGSAHLIDGKKNILPWRHFL
jgi:hypothetical protein